MKLGTRFTRDGERFEFLGYVGTQLMRVRVLRTGEIVSILTPAAKAERERRLEAIEVARDRKRKAAEAEAARIRAEAELLIDRTPALRKLRDEAAKTSKSTTASKEGG